MALPTRDELLALDYPDDGLPFVEVLAKSTVSPDTVSDGLPFLVFGDAGGGPPPEPPAHPPTYLALVASDTPVTATTFVRETGDVFLSDDGFTLIEEDETPFSTPATIYLFQTSTPTSGSWVLGRDYRTNAKTDGALRSPLPATEPAIEDATLTIVTTAPNTRVSFEWGIWAMNFSNPSLNDVLRFYIDDVEQWFEFPADAADGGPGLTTGTYSFVVPAGTYDLKWQWQRYTTYGWYSTEVHAWIAALIIDPNF